MRSTSLLRASLMLTLLGFGPWAGAQTRPVIESVEPSPIIGSNGAQWLTVRGRGFRPDFNARIRTVGIDAAISDPRSLEFRTENEVAILKVFGNEASWWTVEVSVPGAPPSAPFSFQVVPPNPVIESVAVSGAEPGEEGYTLTITGPDLTNYTRVLIDGDSVDAEPIRTSQYISALTVGFEASLPSARFDPFEPHTVRLFTPEPGGGYSDTHLLAAQPVPFRARWSTWFGAALLGLLLSMGTYVVGKRLARGDPALLKRDAERVRQLEEEAAAARDATQTLDRRARQRARLIADVTHDARTHLQLVLDPLREALEVDESPRGLLTAQRGAMRLQNLLDQLLDLARFAVGELRLRQRRADLALTVRQATFGFERSAERRGVRLAVEAPDTPVFEIFDVERIARVVENLVSNAVKYTPSEGEVVVSLTREDDTHVVRVTDTGVGMSSAQVDSIFRPECPGRSSRVGGVGLGLSLARELAALHGGGLDIESTQGLGTAVTFSLPVQTTASVADQTRTDVVSAPESGETSAPREASSEKRPRVLLVDDDDDLLGYLARALSERFEVDQACDGAEALRALERTPADVVVTDLDMPQVDGVALVEEILDAEHDAILIMMTGQAREIDAATGLDLGADDYIAKPFSVRELIARIDGHLRRRETYRDEIETPDGRIIPSMNQEFVQKAYDVAYASLSDSRFNVSALAIALGVSPGHLRKRFRAILDQSPSQWLRALRLESARELLEARAGRVSEIADQVGMVPERFTERFKAK